uniref:Transposase IS200-like domain-containing protein n=1 Tax=Candidatus Methanogaster sp. ANME-2c ERB4 TaxID=2759911 RepID=A0A7G9Y7I7_9EURY|nr:hypothetical protein FICJDHNH_00014 [Methanosarcinales archaeon ANME-2c ERB4]QNO43971.1 hypothetical protein AECFJODE_00024 [Methanosarcinales archaeon ANME-2c ERB4]
MAVNMDHVHLFVKYPPKYSVSYITKRIKGRMSRELPEGVSASQGMVRVLVSGYRPVSMDRSGMNGRLRERYIQNQEKPNAKTRCTGSVLKSGV